jgi:hypothetical protein
LQRHKVTKAQSESNWLSQSSKRVKLALTLNASQTGSQTGESQFDSQFESQFDSL